MPFWNLTRNLRHLDLHLAESSSFVSKQALEEQDEEACTAFELPTEPLVSPEARCSLHNLITCRTVAAAARSGHLQTLSCLQADAPFAVRALLPHWIALKKDYLENGDWQITLDRLRALLSHASLWLGTAPISGPRQDPELTPQEIQQLSSYLNNAQALDLKERLHESEMHLLECCLSWLQDAELARRAADAWKSGLLGHQVQNYQKAQLRLINPPGFRY